MSNMSSMSTNTTTPTPTIPTITTPPPTPQVVYDYIIVGSGPCGLTLAQLLSRNPSLKILILEAAPTFGGCHSVQRVGTNRTITEHSPRINSTSYINFINYILPEFGVDFYKEYTPYRFSLSTIGKRDITSLKAYELYALTYAFWRFSLDMTYGNNVSMSEFMDQYNFTPDSRDYIDQLARLVDGADATRFPLSSFLQIANQEWLNKIYQPVQPNDVGVFKKWTDFLINRGVLIKYNEEVVAIDPIAETVTTKPNQTYRYKRLVLSINPYAIVHLDDKLFPNISMKYASDTRYNTYLSFSFEWPLSVQLPDLQGFEKTPWGVAFIDMTRYFKNYPTNLLSLSITRLDEPSPVLGLSANEISDPEMIFSEAWRQIKTSFPGVPDPPIRVLYPGVKYRGKAPDGGWVSTGGSFIDTAQNGHKYIPFKSPRYPNIYNLGVQNGYHSYAFTALESAITNSMACARELEPTLQHDPIKATVTVVQVLRLIILTTTITSWMIIAYSQSKTVLGKIFKGILFIIGATSLIQSMLWLSTPLLIVITLMLVGMSITSPVLLILLFGLYSIGFILRYQFTKPKPIIASYRSLLRDQTTQSTSHRNWLSYLVEGNVPVARLLDPPVTTTTTTTGTTGTTTMTPTGKTTGTTPGTTVTTTGTTTGTPVGKTTGTTPQDQCSKVMAEASDWICKCKGAIHSRCRYNTAIPPPKNATDKKCKDLLDKLSDPCNLMTCYHKKCQ